MAKKTSISIRLSSARSRQKSPSGAVFEARKLFFNYMSAYLHVWLHKICASPPSGIGAQGRVETFSSTPIHSPDDHRVTIHN